MESPQRRSPHGSPTAVDLDYPDSTLDVVVRDDRAEFLPDRTRPMGSGAWLSIDADHLVADVHEYR